MSTRISTSDVLRQRALRVDSVVLLTQFRFIWPHRKNVAARPFLRCTPPLPKVSITSLAREHLRQPRASRQEQSEHNHSAQHLLGRFPILY